MSLQVIAEKVSVYEVTGTNEFGQPVATDHIYQRGQVLPDWVDGHQAFVLVNTGLAAEVGDHPDSSLRPLQSPPAPVILPEHNPASVPGSGVTGPMVVTDRVDETGAKSAAVPEGKALPSDTDTKFVWENYAVSDLPAGKRMTRPEAESMKKTDLMTEVKNRYNEAMQEDELDDEALPPKF